MQKASKIKGWLSKIIIRVFGNIQFFPYLFNIILWGDTHYRIKGPETRKILNTIQPGDILLRRYNRYVSGWVIPGYFTHAAIVSGTDSVIHATTHGIFKEDILTFLRADEIAILRFPDITCIEINEAIVFASSVLSRDYDFEFGTDDKRFCCTSLVRKCFPKRFKDLDKPGYTIVPDDYLYQGMKVLHDSREFMQDYS